MKKVRLLLVAFAALVFSALYACNGGETTEDDATDTTTTAVETEVEETNEPAETTQPAETETEAEADTTTAETDGENN